jgi:hypothetical protein
LFEQDRTFRYLYVPVKAIKKENKRKIVIPDKSKIYISSDIFEYPVGTLVFRRGIWKTDHSKEIYVGGSGPAEITVYIGNRSTQNLLS